MHSTTIPDEKLLYCICPKCKSVRKKIDGHFNIIRRGHERNGIARFLCLNCNKWFNEKTCDSMPWLSRF